MNDEILKKLERRMGRRSFLKGSGLAAVGVLGTTAASSVISFAQEKPREEKKPDSQTQADQQPDEAKDNEAKDNEAKDNEKEDTKQDAAQDPYKIARIDEQGREYRMCPVCGSNMYRQDRTWTCENCGYAYEE